MFRSLKKAPLGNNGKKFVIKKLSAPSCREFLEAIYKVRIYGIHYCDIFKIIIE